MASGKPWLDGEKIPEDYLGEVFCLPPGIPSTFYRSSLITGSKGVGKTTLLRYQKRLHGGVSTYVSFPNEFANLTKQTGSGPLALATEYSSDLYSSLCGKATSLLALGIASRLLRKGVPVPADALMACLPSGLQDGTSNPNLEWVESRKVLVARAPLETFDGISELHPIPYLANALGESCLRRQGPLLLLFDRADMVLTPSLVPVFELLDQASDYIALVAMRPTHTDQLKIGVSEEAVAGDHYDVHHIGAHPRSQDWAEFVENSVRVQMEMVQLGEKFSSIPDDVKSEIISISRESLRTTLELFARYLSFRSSPTRAQLTEILESLQENLLTAAQSTLQRYHPDFRRLVKELRARAMAKCGQLAGPLELSIRPDTSNFVFEATTRLSRFVDAALRSGAFCLREGHRWSPGLRPTDLELPPILAWQKGDTLWKNNCSAPVEIVLQENELLRLSGGPVKPPTIFVAYRLKSEESYRFREEIEKAIHAHPNLSGLRIADGRTHAGTEWAPEIRGRIRTSRLVVGDVTGMKSDVLFELGLAYGLGKPIIPVLSQKIPASSLPAWLTSLQLGEYGSKSATTGIISSILAHLSDPEIGKLNPPQPITGLAVWLRELPWNQHAKEQFLTVARASGLKPEILQADPADESIIRRAASASVLVCSLDGTATDSLVHFVCGAVIARPKTGYAATLDRRVFLLEETSQKLKNLVADSLRRCRNVARVVPVDSIRNEVQEYGSFYDKWSLSSHPRKKNTRNRR